jgi:uncharacterized repeat protein (TIGR03803 family)
MFELHSMLKLIARKWQLLAVVLALLAAVIQPAQAQTFTMLHGFAGADGAGPESSVVFDSLGNLYGTTGSGGAYNYGTVFKLTSSGTESVLHSFSLTDTNGFSPEAGLVRDSRGNLYGTAEAGGAYGSGTVFKVTASGTTTALHSFNGTDGANPWGGLIRDSQGNLYGTTFWGGADSNGTVYKVTPSGVEIVLYSFTGGSDGGNPLGEVVRDSVTGNLYGTTNVGGAYGCGAVYKLTPSGVETVLYSFTGGKDGGYPSAGVVRDSAGNLFGPTESGGAYNQGTVFELTAAGTEKVLYSFTGGADGCSLEGGIVKKGSNIYGTTYMCGAYNFGTVFRVTTAGKETTLHSFNGSTDGGHPWGADLVMDKYGNLYGTTGSGGTGSNGTVFEVILPNFTITDSPTSATLSAGQSTNSTLTLSPVGGLTGTVKLSCMVPAGYGLSCGVSPTSVTLSGTPATADLSINTSSTTPTGVYRIKAKGVSGTLANTTTFTLTVQ